MICVKLSYKPNKGNIGMSDDIDIDINKRKVKLFGLIPLYSWEKNELGKKWKILGLPVYKKKVNQNGNKIKYYFLGIPVFKIVRKYK